MTWSTLKFPNISQGVLIFICARLITLVHDEASKTLENTIGVKMNTVWDAQGEKLKSTQDLNLEKKPEYRAILLSYFSLPQLQSNYFGQIFTNDFMMHV